MFIDKRLDMGFDYGAEGGRGWNTSITEHGGGFETRNENWQDWLGSWQLGERNVTKADYDYLAGFVAGARGRKHTFRYRDWNDYEFTNEAQTIDGSQIQLTKTYGAGLDPYACPITLPVEGALTLQYSDDGETWLDWTEDADYSVAYTTGIVTILGSPPPAYVRASGEFDVHVRFDVERLPARFLAFETRGAGNQRFYQLGSVTVREVRS
jgi:uncharacterized protein (TIGR02217 family)